MNRIAYMIATCFGLGHSPYAPGTVASFVSCGLFFFMPPMTSVQIVIVGFLLTVLAVWASYNVVQATQEGDPSFVVIDEVIGMYVACAFLPHTLWHYALAFSLFRLFDILKPFPIHRIEGIEYCSLGVVFDDVVAGVLAHVGVLALVALVGLR